jgi:hypothetical protein
MTEKQDPAEFLKMAVDIGEIMAAAHTKISALRAQIDALIQEQAALADDLRAAREGINALGVYMLSALPLPDIAPRGSD